ncbi:uncharacterized protein TNCT_142381 [Trichonephila clavata]|uniref:PKD domain-containing protein n=1 Tax=Trichonephila clavata TaxID=2740835 RepID=A0A8X6KZ49_TRICU|nr:uncharacterized protein TNCT_142381 [Trichonephila clavata]
MVHVLNPKRCFFCFPGVTFSTGLTSKSAEQKVSTLLDGALDVAINLKSSRTPRCLPSIYKDREDVPRVFVGDELTLEGSVLYYAPIYVYRWAFSDGTIVTKRSFNSTSVMVHTLREEGLCTINLTVTSAQGQKQVTFLLIAVHRIYFSVHLKSPQVILLDSPAELQISTTVTNNRIWKMELICNYFHRLTAVILPAPDRKICNVFERVLKWNFPEIGKYQCFVHFSDGAITLTSRKILFEIFPELKKVTLEVKNAVKTNETIQVCTNIFPNSDLNKISVKMKILNHTDHSIIFFQESSEMFSLSYAFQESGRFVVHAIVSNPVSQVFNETSIIVQDPIIDLFTEPLRSNLFVKTNSGIKFTAKFSKGTDVHCAWTIVCKCDHLSKGHYNTEVANCSFTHRFVLFGICSVFFSAKNKVSAISSLTPWKVFVEKAITDLQVSIPEVVKPGSRIKVEAYVPHIFNEVHVVIRTKTLKLAADCESKTLIYKAQFPAGDEETMEWIRIRVFNNVSHVVLRRPVLIMPEIGRVSIHSCGCLVVGKSARFLVEIDGNIPSGKSSFLYKWRVVLENNSAVDYLTSVPLIQTDNLEREGTLNVSVVVSNKGEMFPPPPPLGTFKHFFPQNPPLCHFDPINLSTSREIYLKIANSPITRQTEKVPV